jgi:predicted nucleic acid-binding protein
MQKPRRIPRSYPESWELPMTSVAFVDTNIPIYTAGRDRQYKEPCARIIRGIAHNPGRFITDAEVLQELMHHYLRTGRWIAGRQIFLRFETLLQGRIEPT